jgi:glycosyltransferase involved in cell wall biosynthesis
MIQRAERYLGARTDRVLALSERQRAELLGYRVAPEERIQIVPLGLELSRFRDGDRQAARTALRIPQDTVAILAVSRLVPVKRLDRLLVAAAVAARAVPKVRLYIVGDGCSRASLEAQAAALGMADRTVFAGWTADTPNWYAAADIVALTSDNEGTPLSLIEAAAAGRAVVATDVGGVADVVADGETGIVVPAGDEAALAAALIRLARDSELRDRLGAAAPGRAGGYAADRLVDDLDSLYRHLLAERGVNL